MSKFLAHYYIDKAVVKKYFNTFGDLQKHNKEQGINHHNLFRELNLSEIIDDGYVVTIEGDDNLYDKDLGEHLAKLKRYKLLNNIYDEPMKLKELIGLEVDVQVI